MDEKQAEELIRSPVERLQLELKTWLDLKDREHTVKLVRALLALRNFDGGYLIIGFNDGSGDPSPGPPADTRSTYPADDLQQLVATYASDPFGIEVTYPQREGIRYPVIQVPSGVQIPVAVKKDIQNAGGKVILRRGDVMFRTLHANNTVSSAPAAPEDWRKIMDICFYNREADLGGFVRRHLLSGELPSMLAELGLLAQQSKRPGLKDTCLSFADRCTARMAPMEAARGLPPLPDTFGWMEVAAVLDPPATDFIADKAFLGRLLNSRPRYSTEPWLDARVYEQRPVPVDGGWNTLTDLTGFWDMREFSRLEPAGLFYLRRPIIEDMSAGARNALPGTAIDVQSAIDSVAQSMAVVLAFAQALNANLADTKIGFLLRYEGLHNRRLISLRGAVDVLLTTYRSTADTFEGFVEFPADTSPINLGPFVYDAVREFLASFDGYSITLDRVEQETRSALRPV